jgi:hypothetical protein
MRNFSSCLRWRREFICYIKRPAAPMYGHVG